MRVPLTKWAISNEPDEKLIYKSGMWAQVKKVRDHIYPLLCRGLDYEQVHYYDEEKGCGESYGLNVCSFHSSKSVKLPVFLLEPPGKGLRIRMRDNYYDWKISVESDHEIDIDWVGLWEPYPEQDPSYSGHTLASCYFEGFQPSWVFGHYGESDKKKFSLSLGDRYLHTFFFLMMRSLEREEWVKRREDFRKKQLIDRDKYRARHG